MSSRSNLLERSVAAETWSPELVLIDPGIAARARQGLEEPEDTLARLEHEIWLSRLSSLGAAAEDDSVARARPRPQSARAPSIHRRGRRFRRWLVPAVAIAATLLVAFLLFGVSADPRSTRATADLDQSQPPAATTASPSRQKVPRRSRTPVRKSAPSRNQPRAGATRKLDPGPRRFAWAPVPDASGYHVEFFRGTARIYARNTTNPQLVLPRTWTFRGRENRLAPGKYRWYVWPIVSGLRQSRATVQAELVVPRNG